MVTLAQAALPRTIFPRIDVREELRAMLANAWVQAIAIIMAGLIVLGALGGIVLLAVNDKGTDAIGGLLIGLLGLMLGQQSAIKRRLDQVAAQPSTVELSTQDGARTVVSQGIQPEVHIGH